jgi:hypothetical protein
MARKSGDDESPAVSTSAEPAKRISERPMTFWPVMDPDKMEDGIEMSIAQKGLFPSPCHYNLVWIRIK